MKKICFALVLLFSLSLFSCDPGTYHFDQNEMLGNVESVELIDYRNSSSDIVEVTLDTKLIFDSSKVINSISLEDNKMDDFIKELCQLTFHTLAESSLEPVKECLKISNKDGSFIILSCTLVRNSAYTFAAEFDNDGNFVKHIAAFAEGSVYKSIIVKHFYS